MNKGDLVEKIAASTGITKTSAAAAIDTLIDAVSLEERRQRYDGNRYL